MIRFALSARTSTDDLQDPVDSLRWQKDTAARLVEPHGEIVTVYHDIDKSRSLPWDRRPEASRILRDLKDVHRGWDALVIAEPQRAFSGTQFEGILFQFAHYGVGLWIPELGGAVDINNDGHYMALSNYGTMSRAERNRTRLRVANAVRAHAQAGRWLGGRPPYGYLIADLGPHSNPSKAASGARLHQLAPDPMTAPVVQRIYELYLSGAGYKQIATVLTNEGIPSPSAHDRTRNSHRSGHAWAMSAVRTILANPRYLGYHVSGRTKKADILLDPDSPALGHVTRQRWQDRAEWVTASVQTYEAIVDEATWHQVAGLIAANARTNAVTSTRHRTRSGVRRAEPSRYPLAGLVVCDCCDKKLQGNLVRGHAFYRCKVSSDYPAAVNDHPRTLAVREDRLLPHVDAWLCELFAPDLIEKTASEIVHADAQGHREDPAVTRARNTLTECERKLAKHLDGLEAGIPADVIAARIAATQREKSAAESVLATAPPAPAPLTLEEVMGTLAELRDLPEILERIEQADRAALYQALGLNVRYRRIGSAEEVKLTSTLRSVDLERVGVNEGSKNSQVNGLQGVDLERVGGRTPTCFSGLQPSPLDRVQGRTSSYSCCDSVVTDCGRSSDIPSRAIFSVVATVLTSEEPNFSIGTLDQFGMLDNAYWRRTCGRLRT
jgi:DNA invertase Pin-like site-specific DNA recombinase